MPVPFVQVIGLVPQIDPLEAAAVPLDDNVKEVGERLRVARRRRGFRLYPKRRWGVEEAGKQLDAAGDVRQQPVVPGGSFLGVEVGPGNGRAKPADAEGGEAVKRRLHPLAFTGAEPFHDPGAIKAGMRLCRRQRSPFMRRARGG